MIFSCQRAAYTFPVLRLYLIGVSISYLRTSPNISHNLVKHRRPLAFAAISFGGSVGGIIYPIIVRNLLPAVGYVNVLSFSQYCLIHNAVSNGLSAL